MYKKFIKPVGFLLAGCVILLLSDLQNRKNVVRNSDVKRIAVFRFNSTQILEDTEIGFLERIHETGHFKTGHLKIRLLNPEGDMPTANMIAKNIISEKFNLVVSISTPGLQVMANANKSGEIIHIFCAVTDPMAAGVGITGPEANQHPPFMAGIGTFQPVEEVFRIARIMFPDLRKVGVAWCTSETCSEACVYKAREACLKLGIELVEKNVESVSQVFEAAIALCSDQVEALWIGCDYVVEPAMNQYVSAGLRFGIPVLTNNPSHSFSGALVSLGADYQEVGRMAADMVDSVLNGFPVSRFETRNKLPEMLYINDSIRLKLKERWIIPPELESRIDSLIR